MNFKWFLIIHVFLLITCKSNPVLIEKGIDSDIDGVELDSFPIEMEFVNYLHDNEYHYDVIDTFSNPLEKDVALKKCIIDKYALMFTDSLKENIIPNFIYNECLDIYKFQYCYISSDETQSLRYDLLENLTDKNIDRLLSLGKIELFEKKCERRIPNLVYNDKSLIELIDLVNQKRNGKP